MLGFETCRKESLEDYFKNIYENTIQKGETFSYDMGKYIQQELEKMCWKREEWLKNKHQKQEEDETGTISESSSDKQ